MPCPACQWQQSACVQQQLHPAPSHAPCVPAGVRYALQPTRQPSCPSRAASSRHSSSLNRCGWCTCTRHSFDMISACDDTALHGTPRSMAVQAWQRHAMACHGMSGNCTICLFMRHTPTSWQAACSVQQHTQHMRACSAASRPSLRATPHLHGAALLRVELLQGFSIRNLC